MLQGLTLPQQLPWTSLCSPPAQLCSHHALLVYFWPAHKTLYPAFVRFTWVQLDVFWFCFYFISFKNFSSIFHVPFSNVRGCFLSYLSVPWAQIRAYAGSLSSLSQLDQKLCLEKTAYLLPTEHMHIGKHCESLYTSSSCAIFFTSFGFPVVC